MKTMIYKCCLFFTISLLSLQSCNKTFLDKKPNTGIVQPRSLDDFQNLLDNAYVFGRTGALPQMASDDYFVDSYETWESLYSVTERNSYVWDQDLYGGETKILDWNDLYSAIFYANSVLDGIAKIDESENDVWKCIKGSALFLRAYSFFDLARNFCKVYDVNTAKMDLGLPLKLSSGIDEIRSRASVEQTYGQILKDLGQASHLLEGYPFPTENRNRPSKEAVLALTARIYLAMGDYSQAELYADSCLAKYNKLINYNEVCLDCATPFSVNSDEVIYSSAQVLDYGTTLIGPRTTFSVDSNLINTYDRKNDLRFPIFFTVNVMGNYNVKRGYISSGSYQFSGLAVDEILLIRAECLARKGAVALSMVDLNTLLENRYVEGKFKKEPASSQAEALEIILLERRKELVWRALRWSDLKRLNKEGANITLRRRLGTHEYILPPNDPRYIFPIPDDELTLSGIKQNIR